MTDKGYFKNVPTPAQVRLERLAGLEAQFLSLHTAHMAARAELELCEDRRRAAIRQRDIVRRNVRVTLDRLQEPFALLSREFPYEMTLLMRRLRAEDKAKKLAQAPPQKKDPTP